MLIIIKIQKLFFTLAEIVSINGWNNCENLLQNKTNAVKILDLPNCISSSINFKNYKNLHTLILGVGYKGNLDLKHCNCLSKTSLLDLFNKVATLGEGESYTITLHSNYKHMFTDSEIKQVTDKGWTVAYYS